MCFVKNSLSSLYVIYNTCRSCALYTVFLIHSYNRSNVICFNITDNKISYLTQVPGKNHSKNYCDKEIVCPNLSTLALSRNALDSVEQFVIVSTTLRTLYLVILSETHKPYYYWCVRIL